MKFIVVSIVAAATMVGSMFTNVIPFFGNEKIVSARWEGATDIEMLTQVRADLEKAKKDKADKLQVAILSSGGPVITSLEIARLIRKASNEGLVVEITAEGVCASGCTFVLASATPGHRFITRNSLYLVHPIQVVSFFGGFCVDRKGMHGYNYDPDAAPSSSEQVRDKQADKPKLKTEQEKVIDALYDAMVDQYMEYSGQDKDTVERWFECGRSQAGRGELAVKLHLADEVRG